jgi:hypothetical protein
MRRVLHGDVVAVARALLAVKETARAGLVHKLMDQATRAEKYRRLHGRVHPFWGDGSLEVAASAQRQVAEPYLDAPEYCTCMLVVFEALAKRRTQINRI